MFIRNAWYVAAWDRDLTDQLMPLTLLGDAVVLYRQSNGRVVALEDACVHRKLPLSMGRIQGDLLECGYHGLRYDATGSCVHIPCSDRIPRKARVRSYPIEARYGLLWIWMGLPQLADVDTIMAVAHWGDPAWSATRGDSMTVDCNYLYVTDNLLDPSHVAWVHPSSFGDASCEAAGVDITASAGGLCASRWMTSAEVAPLYRRFVRFAGLCDRLQHYEVRFPSHALVKAVFVPAGSKSADAAAHAAAFVMDSYNFLTPVDESHTRYFWFQVHNAADADGRATEALAAGVKGAFEEDRVILNAVQKSFERSKTASIDISIDSAPLRFRRSIRRLIDAEAHADRPADNLAGSGLDVPAPAERLVELDEIGELRR
jgi:phenylpropionate dioxygenase-like ring-hydroxylating dioxygenase large terminal subunit